MLAVKKNNSIRFNEGKIQFLVTDKYKQITENFGSPILCGAPTVGYRRFFEAKQAGVSADLVVTVPIQYQSLCAQKELLEYESFRIPGKAIYRVVQVQIRPDSAPPCLQLTLQKEREPYEDKRRAD